VAGKSRSCGEFGIAAEQNTTLLIDSIGGPAFRISGAARFDPDVISFRPARKGHAWDSATRNIYSAGSEWCSCITRHRPVFRSL